MTDTNPESEPSMEEILASIRRIISDGDAGEDGTEPASPAEAGAPEAEAPATVAEPGPEDDILDLTQMVTEQGEVVDLNEAKTARGMTPAATEAPAEELTTESLADALAEAAERDATGEETVAEVTPAAAPEPEAEISTEVATVAEPEVEIPEAPPIEPEAIEPEAIEPEAVEPEAVESEAFEPAAVEPAPVEPATLEAAPPEAPPIEAAAMEEPVPTMEEVAAAVEEGFEATDSSEPAAQALLEPAPVMPMISDSEVEAPEAEAEPTQPPFSVDELAEIEAATAEHAEAHAEAQPFGQEAMPGSEAEDADIQADALVSVEAVETPQEATGEAPLQESSVMAAQSAEEWSAVPEGPDSSDDSSLIDFAPEEDEVEEQPELVVEPVREERREGLISETAAAGAIAALSGLADAARSSGQSQQAGATPLGMNRTLEELVKEAIAPHLKAWLDANLEPLVERIVREEIQRLRRRSENF